RTMPCCPLISVNATCTPSIRISLSSTAPRPPRPTLFPYTTLFRSKSLPRRRTPGRATVTAALVQVGRAPGHLLRRHPRAGDEAAERAEGPSRQAADEAQPGNRRFEPLTQHREPVHLHQVLLQRGLTERYL